PGNLKIEDLKKLHSSHPSNTTLANVLYFGDYIQQVGSGTNEMVRQCKEHGLPEPEFVSVRNLEFKTILPRDMFTEVALQQLGLNERQIGAVKFIKNRGQITNKEYQENFGLKKRQATDDLKELENKGVIKKIGKTGRGTYYVLRGANGAKGAPKGR
ncbi:MAG: ATP-binding protein, partial [Candidatus Omnitrophota bacterium]|nr:ATP-binding protein [Candidatus Omnitrophota bacterium]